MRRVQDRAERGQIAGTKRDDRGLDTFVLAEDMRSARAQHRRQSLDRLRIGLAQRAHAEQLARAPALRAALVVARARVRVALARVHDRESPSGQAQRHRVDLEPAKVDPQRLRRRAVERRELIEQTGFSADPLALDARAQLRDREPVELSASVGAPTRSELDQCQRERHLERGRGGQTAPARHVAADLDARGRQRVAGADKLDSDAAHVRSPAARGRRRP